MKDSGLKTSDITDVILVGGQTRMPKVQEAVKKFFGKDPFYQGLKENYNDVENLIKFADQQGMLGRKLSVEELFTENTRNT